MGWNPFKRKQLTGTPAVLDAIQNRGWQPWPLLGGGSRDRIVDAYNTAQSANYAWTYANSPAVRTVVDVIVRNIGQLDLRLYEEVSESERQPRPDHPAALSLRYPNDETTSDSLVRGLFKDFLLYDNAYALMFPGPSNRISLAQVPAHMVEVRGSSLFRAEGYRVHLRDGTYRDFAPENVMHWRGENPNDPRVGVSRLDTLRGVIAEDAALQTAIVELAKAGMTEPTWVFRPAEAPDWENDDRKGFEEDLRNRLSKRNRGFPVVLEEGMELKSFGVSPRDAQMFEQRRWAIEMVAREYGLPLGMVGLAENLEEARSQFYTDTLPPYCEEFTRMLDLRILVRAYNWTDGTFEFNLDEKHMGDDRLKALVSATGRPVMLTNEGRAKLNLPPVEGGDELVTPLNVTVGENPQPSVDVVNPDAPNGQPRGVGFDQEPKRQLPAAPKPKAEAEVQLHPGRKAELERQHRNIDIAQAVVERHFTRLERSLREKARKNVKASQDDWRRWNKEFTADVHRAVEQIVEKEGEIYAFKLAGGAFDMARVKNYLQAMAEGAAEGINSTIREEIDTAGVDDAFAKRAQHVASAGAGLGAGATRWAREEAARQSPGYEDRVKTWIANTSRHAEFAGETVPIGENWPAGFAPGATPGCRCSMSIS